MFKKIPLIVLLGFFSAFTSVWAGPPFGTDDPEPVEYQHWEIFLAASYGQAADGWSGSAPQLDINYGFLPEAHVNLVLPFAVSSSTGGPQSYGYGDTELGVKIRFLKETPDFFQAAIYPRVVFATGDALKGLGEGQTRFLLPLWIQKTWEPWTTYGGVGYWFDAGSGNKDSLFAGWVLTREISAEFSLGGELLFHGGTQAGEGDQLSFNLGGSINFDSVNHLVLSAGRDLLPNGNTLNAYLAYQWTFPGE